MRLFSVVFLLVASLATTTAASDWLHPEVAYSATRTLRTGGIELSGPVHYDGGKERFEMTVEDTRQIMIRRDDKQRLYMIMPQMGMGMELPYGESATMPSADSYADLKPESVGRETLGGEAVTKYRVEAGDAGESYTVFVWATDDGIALRMEGGTAEGSFEMVLSDLRRGPQPAELFEVPAGTQMMTMPAQ